ncbi:MAG: hypothetical protein QOF76_1887 [Solirubrobacteraceae bacterium]|nr:hypothetical protein [Solirubrobacteraceae bacterium]
MDTDRPIGRRAFLGFVGVGLSSLAWGGSALDLINHTTELIPKGLRSAFPFGEGWRIYAIQTPYPEFSADTWELRIDGLVEHPQTLSYAQLLALPQARQTTDFHCVTGWSVDDVRWQGVRLQDLFAAAKPLPTAKAVRFQSAETPYVDSLTLEQALAPDAMLAHTMDGDPLTREHGAPVRMVIPQMYGYKGVKWVQQITLTATAEDGYWEQRGYDRDAFIGNSNGR